VLITRLLSGQNLDCYNCKLLLDAALNWLRLNWTEHYTQVNDLMTATQWISLFMVGLLAFGLVQFVHCLFVMFV